MGRKKLTDGTKKIQYYFLISENDLKAIGKEVLDIQLLKTIDNLVNKIKKGKHPNQIDLIDSIEEITKDK